MADAAYTADDHEFRENDEYAQAKYAITLRWLGPSEGRRLVNIGCGSGLFNRLAHEAGFAVEACEPDAQAHRLARAGAPRGVIVHLGGLFDAPIEEGADVVVIHDVLEHIDDERAAVTMLRRLTANSGTVIISVPALRSLFGYHDEQLGHHRRYTRKSLRAVVEPTFRIRRIRYFGMSLIPATLWYSRWRRRPYPTGAASGPSIIGRGFALVCRGEAHIPTPIGTSLVCELIPGPSPTRSRSA